MNQPFRPRLNLTRELKFPNMYTQALGDEFRSVAFDEERAPLHRGQWRADVFHVADEIPLDLEIGTGVGYHFQHHALKHPERCLLGLEIKYKPLIQTIRRTIRAGAKNAAVARFHAFDMDQLLAENEINDVYIHFPDPWTSPKKPKNRVVQKHNLDLLYKFQRPGSKLEFKTDSREAFDWCLDEIKKTPYRIDALSFDLHKSEFVHMNFVTAFERIFLKKGLPISYICLFKD